MKKIYVTEKKTNKSISFSTLKEALEYVSGNYDYYDIFLYGNKYIYSIK